MEKFKLPTVAEFEGSGMVGPKSDWMVFDSLLIGFEKDGPDVWAFHHRMLELVGHKSEGSVPVPEIRVASYSVLINTWNSFDSTPTSEEFENRLRARLGLDN